VYRYVASRDDLLTSLFIAAYHAVGVAAETSEAAVARDAVRGWALASPNEHALIDGTPVPGYVAPTDTVARAARVLRMLVGILLDATAAGRLAPDALEDDVSLPGRVALAPVCTFIGPKAPDAVLQRGLLAGSSLFGTVSFELFGHLHNVVGDEPGDRDAFFTECVRRWATQIGLAPQETHTAAAPPVRHLNPHGRRRDGGEGPVLSVKQDPPHEGKRS
jgi:hypothetical protein